MHRSNTHTLVVPSQPMQTYRLISESVSWHREAAAAALQETFTERFCLVSLKSESTHRDNFPSAQCELICLEGCLDLGLVFFIQSTISFIILL